MGLIGIEAIYCKRTIAIFSLCFLLFHGSMYICMSLSIPSILWYIVHATFAFVFSGLHRAAYFMLHALFAAYTIYIDQFSSRVSRCAKPQLTRKPKHPCAVQDCLDASKHRPRNHQWHNSSGDDVSRRMMTSVGTVTRLTQSVSQVHPPLLRPTIFSFFFVVEERWWYTDYALVFFMGERKMIY